MSDADRPLFSVITANYNSGTKLAASIASVQDQDVRLEHLIIDGASKDESLPAAEQAQAQTPSALRVVSEPDRGVYDAMNKGLRLARGRYIYFLGAGDLLRPGALGQIESRLPAHDHGFVYGDVMFGDKQYGGQFSAYRMAIHNICHQSCFYGRELFEWLGEYDLKYRHYADWEFNIRCFGDPRVRPTHVPLIVADYEAGGISTAGDAAFGADRLKLLRRHYSAALYLRVLAYHALRKTGVAIGKAFTSLRKPTTESI